MKTFDSINLDVDKCKVEIGDFKTLLDSKPHLKEREELLPHFRSNTNLSALIGTYVADIRNPDKIAYEYDLFGDFACDLVVGDSSSKTYLFVELEDAAPNSIFQKPAKFTPEWSQRLEHGYSQIIDWFWKLEDQCRTSDFKHRFGSDNISYHGLLIVGRSSTLSDREGQRLKWRQDKTIVNSNRISIITFDQLYEDLNRVLSYRQ